MLLFQQSGPVCVCFSICVLHLLLVMIFEMQHSNHSPSSMSPSMVFVKGLFIIKTWLDVVPYWMVTNKTRKDKQGRILL